jgi:monothiol glutaredoxin
MSDTDTGIQAQIRDTVEQNRVVLFMKGTKNFPQCGFSARAVEILKKCGATFKDVNVLADPVLRQGIKEFSAWPTIPQVYVDGKFLGGSDILTEMFQSGELAKLLAPAPA